MTLKILAKQALISSGWQQDISVTVDDFGRISDISKSTAGIDKTVGILLPALSNLHSHSFQRAMAGLAEQRGATSLDDFNEEDINSIQWLKCQKCKGIICSCGACFCSWQNYRYWI